MKSERLRRVTLIWWGTAAILAGVWPELHAQQAETKVDVASSSHSQEVFDLLSKAGAAVRDGKEEEAIDLANRAVKLADSSIAARFARAKILDQLRKFREALEDFDAVIAARHEVADLYRQRGRTRFKSGNVTGSIEDFQRFAELAPERARELWELGISYYYAEEYARGAAQFEAYQTYHAADVENVVWRYLCQAAAGDLIAARKDMLPLEGRDSRVPMMEIYALFQGKAAEDEVLAAARRSKSNEKEDRTRLFYAHLYLGLYHHSHGNTTKSTEHIRHAHNRQIDHYMWDVANVHLGGR